MSQTTPGQVTYWIPRTACIWICVIGPNGAVRAT